jgi:hypothetical protein
LERSGRVLLQENISALVWRERGEPYKFSVRIDCIGVEILTQDFQDMKKDFK